MIYSYGQNINKETSLVTQGDKKLSEQEAYLNWKLRYAFSSSDKFSVLIICHASAKTICHRKSHAKIKFVGIQQMSQHSFAA